jgi:thiol-disulfide isomerase/thioredoxin
MRRLASLRLAVLAVLVCCLLKAGCQENTPPASDDGATTTVRESPSSLEEPSTADESEVTVQEVTVQVGSWADVQQRIASQRGKVVVVDVWSTWCEPCVREFPNLVELHRQYPDDVVCISLNIDYIGVATEPPESFRDKVLSFARKHEATFQNIISSDPDEKVLKALNAFSVPVVQVYDRDGTLQKTFTNDDDQYGDRGFTYEDHIVPLIQSLREGEVHAED